MTLLVHVCYLLKRVSMDVSSGWEWGKEETLVTLTYECATGVIWIASILLSNATECPREMSPFHTDNRN